MHTPLPSSNRCSRAQPCEIGPWSVRFGLEMVMEWLFEWGWLFHWQRQLRTWEHHFRNRTAIFYIKGGWTSQQITSWAAGICFIGSSLGGWNWRAIIAKYLSWENEMLADWSSLAHVILWTWDVTRTPTVSNSIQTLQLSRVSQPHGSRLQEE